jgi:glucokinase
MMRTIGAVDIGGTKIALAAVREDGIILNRCEFPTEPAKGFHHAMSRIRQMFHIISTDNIKLEGIGVACPGPLNPITGVIGDVGTLPSWKNGNLIAELQAEFAVPIAVENDADAAALAEATWGTEKSSERLIYITISTGIGCGIVFSGKLYRGAGGAHPEIGHQIIDNSGPLCYCKAHGCWESLASGSAMASWMREQLPDAISSTSLEICEKARNGDPLALRAVEREGHYLGLGLANLVTIFTPDTIALGGGVMKDSALFLHTALKVVRDTCTQVPVRNTHIILASLGQDTGLLGAAQAWFCRY